MVPRVPGMMVPGRIELHVDQQSSHHQHQDCQVGVGEPVQDLFTQSRIDGDQLCAARVQHHLRTIEASDRTAIHVV